MFRALKLEGHLFGLALRFLTCLPVGRSLPESDDLRVRAHKYFPLVGALVGAGGAVLFWSLCAVYSPAVSLVISMVAALIATRAFHEDGLAHAMEALARGAGRAQMLEVMARPGTGLVGALSVGVVWALKILLLTDFTLAQICVALVMAQMLGMMAVIHVIATTPYIHSAGLEVAAPYITPGGYRVALATTLIGLIVGVSLIGVWPVALMVLGSILLGQVFRLTILHRLGGYNSDCLGAVTVLSELGAYLGLAIWL